MTISRYYSCSRNFASRSCRLEFETFWVTKWYYPFKVKYPELYIDQSGFGSGVDINAQWEKHPICRNCSIHFIQSKKLKYWKCWRNKAFKSVCTQLNTNTNKTFFKLWFFFITMYKNSWCLYAFLLDLEKETCSTLEKHSLS